MILWFLRMFAVFTDMEALVAHQSEQVEDLDRGVCLLLFEELQAIVFLLFGDQVHRRQLGDCFFLIFEVLGKRIFGELPLLLGQLLFRLGERLGRFLGLRKFFLDASLDQVLKTAIRRLKHA